MRLHSGDPRALVQRVFERVARVRLAAVLAGHIAERLIGKPAGSLVP
jgi:hypothetical protein